MDPKGRTPLHYAALENQVDQVRQLLDEGIDPDAQDRDGFTALHLAAQQHSVAAGQALLTAGATVDLKNAFGNTALFVAVGSSLGRGDFIAMLRASGADPLVANGYGQTPVGLARLIGNYDVAQYFEDVDDT